MLIYENVCREFGVKDLADKFSESYQVRDWGKDVPHEGVFIGSIAGSNWIRVNRPRVKQWATFENYACSFYYPQIQELLFNDKYAFIPFKDLARRKWDIYGWLGKESLIFIRPDSGEKSFPAELVDIEDIDKLVDDYDYRGLAVVSTPKNFIGEWRFVVSGGKIWAVSSYRYQGIYTCVPSAPLGAEQLVQRVINKGVSPDDIFCVDVVQDTAGDFWVMELTSFSSAGLYACNVDKIAELLKSKL